MKHNMADLTDRELLIQLTVQLDHTRQQLRDLDSKLERVDNKIEKLEAQIKRDYVSKEEHDPIRKLVYGTVGLIVTAVATALVSLLINTSGPMP